jgi:hypothetical protein
LTSLPSRRSFAREPAFPGQIPDKLLIAEELEGNVIDLEGYELVSVELGHTDTDHTTCLHVLAIGLGLRHIHGLAAFDPAARCFA